MPLRMKAGPLTAGTLKQMEVVHLMQIKMKATFQAQTVKLLHYLHSGKRINIQLNSIPTAAMEEWKIRTEHMMTKHL